MAWMTRRNFNVTAVMAAVATPTWNCNDPVAGTTVRQNSSMLPQVEFRLVDVFSREPFSGNGLAVFMSNEALPPDVMQTLTREMCQFESIFLESTINPGVVKARVFTMEEELDFAGHPLLGAAVAEASSTTDEPRLTRVSHRRRFESCMQEGLAGGPA